MKTPSRTKGGRGKRVLADTTPDAMAMPPPSTSSVARKKQKASRTRISASTCQDSFSTSGSVQAQSAQAMEEGGRSSTTTTTINQKEITMATLNEIATQVYPDIPSVMNVPLILKIREVLSQEELNKLSVRYRFGEIKPAVCRVVGEFRR